MKRNSKYYLEEKDIKDLKKTNNKIQSLINSGNTIFTEKNNNFYQIIIIEKNLEFNQGIFYNLLNIC